MFEKKVVACFGILENCISEKERADRFVGLEERKIGRKRLKRERERVRKEDKIEVEARRRFGMMQLDFGQMSAGVATIGKC